MGQPISVTSRPGVKPEVFVFEINRSLTGMETHRYAAGEEIGGHRPPDELARRIFGLGGATAITIYSSVITVTAPVWEWDGLRARVEDAVANLYIYYTGERGAPPQGDDGVLAAPATPAGALEKGAEAPAEPAAT